jgi:hypothetical protein
LHLVAAYHHGPLDLPEKIPTRGAEVGDLARAVGRAGPPSPLDAGVIDADPGARQQRDDERRQSNRDQGAGRAFRGGKGDDGRKRRGDVMGNALFEAERARLNMQHVLEEIGPEEHCGRTRGDDGRGRDRGRKRRSARPTGRARGQSRFG